MESCRQELGLLSEISRGLTLKYHGATKKAFGMIFYRPINADGGYPKTTVLLGCVTNPSEVIINLPSLLGGIYGITERGLDNRK